MPDLFGLFLGAFDFLWGFRAATRSGFPELLHLPELFGALLCPHDLTYFRQPFPRSICPLQLVWPDQLQLLGHQRLTELNSAKCIGARHGHMVKPAREVTGHPLHFPGHRTRHFLTGYRFPTTAGEKALVQRGSFDTQLRARITFIDPAGFSFHTIHTPAEGTRRIQVSRLVADL